MNQLAKSKIILYPFLQKKIWILSNLTIYGQQFITTIYGQQLNHRRKVMIILTWLILVWFENIWNTLYSDMEDFSYLKIFSLILLLIV